MSKDIDRELHSLLLDLAPRNGDDDLIDQATVIAEASAIFNSMMRTASNVSTSDKKWKEAKMLDSLLEAMQINYSSNGYDNDCIIDATNLTPEQIIHKAERLRPLAAAPQPMEYEQPFGTHMSILNDDDLEPFYNNATEGRMMDDYVIEDMSLLHPSNVYVPPGWGKNRSDSHIR